MDYLMAGVWNPRGYGHAGNPCLFRAAMVV